MIEQVLRTHLKTQRELADMLATYNGEPAVFNQQAPDDTDPGWAQESQYGRIVFMLDIRDDQERILVGNLTVDASLENGQGEPEDIERIVREAVNGYFFSTDEVTMAAVWTSSQYFTDPKDEVDGVTLVFTLYSFPNQETSGPDPIALLNSWSQENLPSLLGVSTVHVIGSAQLSPVWKPTDNAPAVYWRTLDVAKCSWIPDTYNASWFSATVRGHVMAQEAHTATKFARSIEHSLTLAKRLIFEDTSPLMVDRNIRLSVTAEPIVTGQLTIEATYGVLNVEPDGTPIRHIHMS